MDHEAPLPSGTVTFVFTDIEGSTRLVHQLGAQWKPVVEAHQHLLRAAFQEWGGQEIRTEGDAFFVVFRRATDAVAAAVSGQRALAAYSWPAGGEVRVRMGLHTGEPLLGGGDYVGIDVHRAARISAAGHGGQILLSASTRELVQHDLPEGASLRELGAHRLKDLERPEPIFQIVIEGLPADFPPLRSVDRHRHNLPVQPTPLIGREQETAAVRDLLQSEAVRLVTLTGPGGTGKTRLGLQVAAELLETFPDGVFFVALAPIRDRDLVASTIAQALGVQEAAGQALAESLKAFLQEKRLLLVLDNFEQVLEAAPLVAELLATCTGLKVLATSRAVLHLRGEREFLVPPLALPDLKRLPAAEALSQYAAVTLFIQRAMDVRPDFQVTNETAPAVAEICHRLDGLPLAIELAAARTRLFSPQALLQRLDRRLPLLTGGARDLPARQQTLRDAIAWSYDLLTEGEQKLFRRLSIFIGGFTLEAAEAVCNGSGDLGLEALDGVGSLLDKSLLLQREGVEGEPCFTMLETLREFGLERLQERGEATVHQQHAQFFLGLAEASEAGLTRAGQREWLARLEREHDNFRAALQWARESGQIEAGLRLAGALWRFWWMRGYLTEGRERLAGLLAVPGVERTRAWVKAQTYAALLALFHGDYATARALSQESLAIARQLDDRPGIAAALHNLGVWLQEDAAGARSLHEESLALWREVGDPWNTAFSLNWLGHVANKEGDREAARSFYNESLTIWRELGDQFGITIALNCLGSVIQWQGEEQRAQTLLEESVAIGRELGAIRTTGWALGILAEIAQRQGNDNRARAYLEEELAIRREEGHSPGIAGVLLALGRVVLREDGHAAAESLFRESLGLWRALGNRARIADCLEGLARSAGEQGALQRAAQLFGAAAAVRDVSGTPVPADQCPEYNRAVDALRAGIGEPAFAAAWSEGCAMSPDEVVAYALETTAPAEAHGEG